MTITQLKKRAKDAARLEKLLTSLSKAVAEKTPSFKGKASLMDRANKVQKASGLLAWDLARDAEEGFTH